MALPVRVVDLGHHADQGAGAVVAPVQGQRVEDVPQDPGVGQHQDPPAVEVHAPGGQVRVEAGPDGRCGGVEVVAGVEAGQGAQRPREPGEGVQVHEPHVRAVPEGVPHGGCPRMRDDAVVQGRYGHGGLGRTGSRRHRRGHRRGHRRSHHRTPSAAAARTPDRQPSSWNPHPWYAPAKAVTEVLRRGSARCAATDSGV